MRTSARFWILFVGQFAFALCALGQTPQTGTPPFGSFSGGPDVVNNATSDVHYIIPIVRKKGRGLDFGYDLSYDSWIWVPTASGSTIAWQPVASKTGSWGWQGLLPEGGTYVTYSTGGGEYTCGDGDQGSYEEYDLSNFVYYDRAGTSHSFNAYASDIGKINNWVPGCPTDSEASPASTTGFASTDGSGYTLYLNPPNMANITGYVVDRDGTIIDVPISYMPPGTTGTTSITDRNGNQITSSNGVYTDTLGTTVLTVSGTAPNDTTLSYTAPSGATAKYIVSYKTYTVKTNFQCSGISEFGPTSESLVDKITLPDSSYYQFTYEDTLGDPGDVTGRVASVTLPTGGTISYVYGGLNDGVECSDGTTPGLERDTPDTGSSWWTYTRTYGSGGASTTVIQDPQGNTTTINFSNGYETQRTITQSSNTLETIVTCYNNNFTNCSTATVTAPITKRDVCRYLPNLANPGISEITYDAVGNVTDDKEMDYVPTTNGSPYLSDTQISYAPLGNGIVDRPSTIKVLNNSGTVVAETVYCYDEATPSGSTTCGTTGAPTPTSGTPNHVSVSGSRGNATTINRWVSGSTYLSKKFTYYDTGNVNVATDVNNGTTTYNYANATVTCGNSFPSSISEAITGLSQSFTWNCTGAAELTATDENGKSVTTSYTDADYWRPASITDPTNATTGFYYQPNSSYPTYLLESDLEFGSSRSSHLQYMDGLGRPLNDQRCQDQTCTTLDTVSYGYDADGRLTFRSLPCATGKQGTCSGNKGTTTTYDALGRRTSVTDSGGLNTTYTYTANDVLEAVGPAPSGENTKRKQYEYDALGRLTSVCEITNASGSGSCPQTNAQTGYFTQYTYDALGDLTGVSQSGQPRYYTYDGLGRMTSEMNPESGTKTHFYDTTPSACWDAGTSFKGDLTATEDNGSNYVCMYYDAMHRLTDVGNSNQSVSHCKRFRYDNSSGYPGSTKPSGLTNTLGRLIEAATDQCVTGNDSIITDEWFSYDARGEVSDVYESTPHSGGYHHATQTYWPNGGLDQLTASTGYSQTWTPDGEGRVYSTNQTLTSTTYNTAGEPLQVNFASGDSDSYTYDPNSGRMTQYKFTVNGQSLVGSLTWNPNGSLQQLAITDPFNSANNQTCKYGDPNANPPVAGYDDLGRLISANCDSTPSFSGTYSYDAFGNLNKSGTDMFNATYNSATNQMTSIGGETPSYDANGNVTNDFLNSYSWDVYARPITVDGVAITYDALSRIVEEDNGGAYTQIMYSPSGFEMQTTNGTSSVKSFIPLPAGAWAIWPWATGGPYYRHTDWLGSSRLVSGTQNHTIYYDGAYGPFGEPYAQSGTTELDFTGKNQDVASNVYDFPAREYGVQGRWPSPDPAGLTAVNPMDPQTWNRYAYVRNSPLRLTDPSGNDPCTSGLEQQCTNAGLGSGCIGATPGETTFEECGGYQGMPADGGWFLDSMDPGVGCTMDGFDAPCGLVESAVDSGAAAQCPDNNCSPGLLYRGISFEQWTYSRELQFVCNGDSADDCKLAHDWYVWVSDVDPNNRGRFDLSRWDQFTGGPCNGPCISDKAQRIFTQTSNMFPDWMGVQYFPDSTCTAIKWTARIDTTIALGVSESAPVTVPVSTITWGLDFAGCP